MGDPSGSVTLEETLTQGLADIRAEVRGAIIDQQAKLKPVADDDVGDDPVALTIQRRRRIRNWIAALMLGLGVPGGGGTYYYTQRPNEAGLDVQTRTTNLEKAVRGCEAGQDCSEEDAKASLKGVTGLNSKKADRLGDLHMNQRELVIDVRDETANKLGKIADKLNVVVATETNEYGMPEPATVTEARGEVEAYKKLKKAKLAKEAQRKGDPFADL